MAVLESGKLVEYNIQMSAREPITGNIYKGIVLKVERGLQAAFVDYGAKKHGFLPLHDVSPEYFRANEEAEEEGHRHRGRPFLRNGQEIIVQVARDEKDHKGAMLTTYHLASRPLRRPDAEPPEHGDFPQDRRRRVAQEPDGAHGADLGRGAGGFHRPHRRDEPDQAGALPRLLRPAADLAGHREKGQRSPRAGPDPSGGRFRGALAQGLLHDGDLRRSWSTTWRRSGRCAPTSTRSPPATSR